MKIPKTFQVAGRKYTVSYDNDGRLQERGMVGEVDYSAGTIILCKKDNGSVITRECIEQTFLHEVWHAIWDVLGEVRFKRNEALADSFTGLLHQVLQSGKGEL